MALRTSPNILVSGTPGTGKSTLCKKLVKKLEGMAVVDFGKEAKRRGCREEYDDALECWIIDEEKLSDVLTPQMLQGGNIVDYMHANFWPEPALIDLVITLHTDNTALYDRYVARGYSKRKIEENIDCEIMNVIGIENEEYFGPQEEDDEEEPTTVVVEMASNDEKDVKKNVKAVVKWAQKWKIERDLVKKDANVMSRRISFGGET